MIRHSEPHDQPDLDRLAIAQFCRTPWVTDGSRATAIHVCERGCRVVGCVAYRRYLAQIHVLHVWVEDGFAGQRAAVELLKDLAALADANGVDLVFTAAEWNHGLRRSVEKYGCEQKEAAGLEPDAVFYRRRSKGVPCKVA
jgi:N-acetylglutamate synthase-like GNAT family acetyltransferase